MHRLDPNHIAAVAADIRAALGDDDDAQAFLDTLEGETDALEIVDALIEADQEARAMAAAVAERIKDMQARKSRMEAASAAHRVALGQVLDAIGERKLTRPLATVSRTAPRAGLRITDEAALPSQLCRTKVEPDKAAIKAQLEAGETVPGAELATGPAGVMVRAK